MDPVRPPADDRASSPLRPAHPAPTDGALGGDVRRWMQEADDRLCVLDACAVGVPRADDHGHVTRRSGPEPKPPPKPPPASPRIVEVPVEASSGPRASDRAAPVDRRTAPAAGGIVVASGWGGRARA